MSYLHIHYLEILVSECFVQVEYVDVAVDGCVQKRGRIECGIQFSFCYANVGFVRSIIGHIFGMVLCVRKLLNNVPAR